MFRAIACASIVLSAAASFASFDLMLMPSTDGRIYRYDPVNRISLGSYGASSPKLIAANNLGFSFSGAQGLSTYRVHSYSTGELQAVSSVSTTVQSIDLIDQTAFYLAGNSVVGRNMYTGNAVSVAALTATNITWETGCVIGNYYTAVGINTSTNVVVVQQVNLSSGVVGSLITTTDFVLSGTTLGKAAGVINPNFAGTVAFTKIQPNGTMNVSRYSFTTSGQFSSASSPGFAVSGFSISNMMPAFMAGHSGMWLLGEDGSGTATARITRFDVASSILFSDSFTLAAPGGGLAGTSTFGFIPANVIAPEPSSFLPLGLGAIVLLRRKRKSASK